MSNELKDIVSNLRAAIAYSKKPGNEGQMLANNKGYYKPVADILTPALNQLEAIESLINDLQELQSRRGSPDNKDQILNSVANIVDEYNAKTDKGLQNLNAAKAALSRRA